MDSTAYQLNDDVEIIRRRSALLLFARTSGRSVRVSAVATELLPLLSVGSTFDELHRSLLEAHPRAADIGTRLSTFLEALRGAGILRGERMESPRGSRERRIPLLRLDPFADRLVNALTVVFPKRLLGLIAVLAAIAAVMAVAALAASQRLPSLRALLEHIEPLGLLLFAFVVVPVHELAHALACRLAGVAVGSSGIVLHGGFFPGPYVDTSEAYRLTDRFRRFMIPAAGPLLNLMAAGLAAAMLLFMEPSTRWEHALQTLLLVCLLFVYFDTNPFSPSDGSHCLEAWLDDELARYYAMKRVRVEASDRNVVRRYRIAAVVHLGVSALLFWIWWS